MPDLPVPIIRAKLYRRPMAGDTVRRERLLSLSAIGARGVVVEVRMQQLAFKEEETRTFIREGLDTEISANEIEILQERTEGWRPPVS